MSASLATDLDAVDRGYRVRFTEQIETADVETILSGGQ